MKQLIFILLFLCSLSAQGQQKYTLSDTSSIVNAGGLYYEMRDVIYSNGEELHTKTLLGDTSTLFDAAYSRFTGLAEQMATDARYIVTFPKKITELNKDNTAIFDATGRDVLDSISARLGAPLLEDGWTLRTRGSGAATVAGVLFNVNANGQLRYTVDGQAARNAWLFGAVIHLVNYLGTGYAIDLYRTESGNYKTVDNRITLRRPGGPANRSAIGPPPEPEAIPETKSEKLPPAKTTKKRKNRKL